MMAYTRAAHICSMHAIVDVNYFAAPLHILPSASHQLSMTLWTSGALTWPFNQQKARPLQGLGPGMLLMAGSHTIVHGHVTTCYSHNKASM